MNLEVTMWEGTYQERRPLGPRDMGQDLRREAASSAMVDGTATV